MAEDFASAIRVEMEALEVELRGNAIYRKIKALQGVLREYEAGESLQRSDHGVAKQKVNVAERRSPPRRSSPARERAAEFVRNYLKDRVAPTPIRELFDAMLRDGVELGGKNPINNLSAILSMNDAFLSHGRSGWVLATSGDQRSGSPDVLRDPSGSAESRGEDTSSMDDL